MRLRIVFIHRGSYRGYALYQMPCHDDHRISPLRGPFGPGVTEAQRSRL